jgi:3-hydroxy-9,10-secoandrosta-1,3,5(10)-triene-9,17-dione monooxygenase reductase component
VGPVERDVQAEGEERSLRDCMGRFGTGVVIVAGAADDPQGPAGFVAQSFVSVSLRPPLVSVCPARTSRSWPRIRAGGAVAFSVLGADQLDLCRRFAAPGADKFAGLPWSPAPNGAPLVPGALAWVAGSLEAEHDAGDHTIAVVRVAAFDPGTGTAAPLFFWQGRYGTFGEGT